MKKIIVLRGLSYKQDFLTPLTQMVQFGSIVLVLGKVLKYVFAHWTLNLAQDDMGG